MICLKNLFVIFEVTICDSELNVQLVARKVRPVTVIDADLDFVIGKLSVARSIVDEEVRVVLVVGTVSVEIRQ